MDATHARFERLYEAHEPLVRAYCVRRIGAGDVDDAVAETFAVAWRKIDEVPAGSAELPWLYGVAYRVVSHEWRRAGRLARFRARNSVAEPAVDATAEQYFDDDDRQLVLRAARRLNDADLEILRLTLWEELQLASVAIALGISPDAAKQRAHRARRRLADEFNRLQGSAGASGTVRSVTP